MKSRFAIIFIVIGIWIDAGFSQGGWTPLDGPVAVTLLCAGAAADGSVFVGTWNDGILKSTDAGKGWTGETGESVGRSVRSLAVVNRSVVYAVNYSGGLIWSIDAGKNWKPIRFQDSEPADVLLLEPGIVVAVDSKNGLIWVGGPKKRWSSVPFPPQAVDASMRHWFQFGSDRHGTLFATSFMSDVYLLNRGSRTWKRIGGEFREVSNPRLAVGPDGTAYFYAREGVWRLNRETSQWSKWKSFAGGVRCMVFARDRHIAICTDPPGIFASRGAGRTWERGSWPGGTPMVACFANPRTLIVGTEEDQIVRSSDGAKSWRFVTSGLVRSSVRSLIVLPDSTLVASLQQVSGLFRSPDGGKSWKHIRLNRFDVILVTSFYRAAGNALLAGSQKNGIYRSGDAGLTWTHTLNTDNEISSFDSKTPDYIVASSNGGVFCSRDTGLTWAPIGLKGHKIFSVCFAGSALVASGKDLGLMRSDDSGVTWSKVFHYAPNWISSGPGFLAGGIWGGILRSTDAGSTWSAIAIDSGKPNLIAMAVDSSDGIWVTSMGQGLYHSTDRGLSWTNHRSGLPSAIAKVYTRNRDINPLTGDQSKMLIFARNDVHPRGLSVLVPGFGRKWYLGVEQCGIYETTDLGGTGVPVSTVPSRPPPPGLPPGAQRIPESPAPLIVHDIKPASVANVLRFQIQNHVAHISSDKLAVMFIPPGADKPEHNRPPAIAVLPPVREFFPPDVGSSRELTYTFDAPKAANIGQQDTLTFLLVSRIGAVLMKRLVLRYVDFTDPQSAGERSLPAVISEVITIEKR